MSLEQLQQAIQRLIKDCRQASHGYKHFERVASNTYRLLKLDYPDFSPEWRHDALVLAWTHDLDDPKYNDEKLEKFSLEPSLKVLSPDMARNIILRASFANEQKQLRDTQGRDWDLVLGKYVVFRHILSDADKLDAIDDQGLERCSQYILERYPSLTSRSLEMYEKVHQHAQEKLLQLDKYLYSPTAKKWGKAMVRQMRVKLEYFFPTIEAKSLRNLAAGLNIEGGRPDAVLTSPETKLKSKRTWANLVLVLDHPLHATQTFDKILAQVKSSGFDILENAFENINEPQLFATYLSLMYHYAVVKRLNRLRYPM